MQKRMVTYKFNSKELDAETGLYYYGARFYTAIENIWLSVDPLSDKYPSMSPYMYCAGNPVIFIDPDGREVWIFGEAQKEYFDEVKKGAAALGISVKMDKNGKISAKYNGKGEISKDGQLFMDAVNDSYLKVNMNATFSDYVNGNETFVGGAFMGNSISYSLNGDGSLSPAFGEAFQTVNPKDLKKMDDYYRKPGQTSIHEITEAYQGVKISFSNGVSSGDANARGSVYKQAHSTATPQSFESIDTYIFDREGIQTKTSGATPASRGYYFHNTTIPIKQVNFKK